MNIIEKQKFHPSPLGILVNPYYIIRRRLDLAVREFASQAKGELLDVGCGSMPYRHYFEKVSKYVGLDIEVSGHPEEKKQADAYYDGKSMPFEDGSFDFLLCSEVLEHVFNIDELLIEIRRVLKPGAVAFFTTPFAFPEHEIPYDFARYTSFGMQSLMEKAGFEILKCQKSGTMIHAVGQLVCCYAFERSKVSKPFSLAVQLGFNSVVTATTELLGAVLPKDDRYFCNLFMTVKAR